MPVRHALLQPFRDGRRDRAAREDREPQAGQPIGGQQTGPRQAATWAGAANRTVTAPASRVRARSGGVKAGSRTVAAPGRQREVEAVERVEVPEGGGGEDPVTGGDPVLRHPEPGISKNAL